MTDTAADPARRSRTSVGLAGLAGAACLACCLLPALITAGLLGGALAAGLVAWLPAIAAVLTLSAVVTWKAHRSRALRCSCDETRDSVAGCAAHATTMRRSSHRAE
ncbi:mercuric ion transport protein [Actinopolyspora mzabensis]|uniref:Mercuric ion transport protein n=1 Tax=Actinopolyspora mzabensis TaxID=995066 RepID=A0A1G9DFG0_ACTMZ|nr:hypothetical protein [Actinopolyspora mzabensis]SDK62621.1 mercuric ion transport protein [Actinopolyspora mzabensis]